MKPGDTVEWDIKFNGEVINTHRGTIVATEYWHLVVKVPQDPRSKYATPFMLCGMGDVRLVEE